MMGLIAIPVEDPPPSRYPHTSRYTDEEIDAFIDAARLGWVREGTETYFSVAKARNKGTQLVAVLKRRLPDHERVTMRAYSLGKAPNAECVYAVRVLPRD
jgi:hypothetical protein